MKDVSFTQCVTKARVAQACEYFLSAHVKLPGSFFTALGWSP